MEAVRARASSLVLILFCLGGASRAAADSLTVYAYPAPYGIDWSSPNALAWSTIGNSLSDETQLKNKHAIGHMNFDLSCSPSAATPGGARIVTGQTSISDDEEMAEIFEQGYGLNVFLTPVPGRWESQAEIEADLPIRFARGTVGFMDFAISPAACARGLRYLREYKQKKLDRIYGGLQSRPRKQEGAGCSTFAASVMEVTGTMDPVWATYFRHRVFVPNDLLGGGATGRSVSFLDLLLGIQSFDWNPSARNSYDLSFWDPYYAYYWIQQAHVRPLLLKAFKYAKSFRGNARGVAIDARQATLPKDAFWN